MGHPPPHPTPKSPIPVALSRKRIRQSCTEQLSTPGRVWDHRRNTMQFSSEQNDFRLIQTEGKNCYQSKSKGQVSCFSVKHSIFASFTSIQHVNGSLPVCSVIQSSVALHPCGLQPMRLCPWDFPGKNTRVRCHFFLQGIFLTQGLNPCLSQALADRFFYHQAMRVAQMDLYAKLNDSGDGLCLFITFSSPSLLRQCKYMTLT